MTGPPNQRRTPTSSASTFGRSTATPLWIGFSTATTSAAIISGGCGGFGCERTTTASTAAGGAAVATYCRAQMRSGAASSPTGRAGRPKTKVSALASNASPSNTSIRPRNQPAPLPCACLGTSGIALLRVRAPNPSTERDSSSGASGTARSAPRCSGQPRTPASGPGPSRKTCRWS